ncbi:MAG: LptF/LptG family permease [Bacteroidota bacterium]
MKRLDGLILRSFVGPFLMSLAIILFILVLQFLSLYRYEIFGKGLGGDVIGKLFLFASGRLMITAMPVAILAGALMTFGSMGEHNELAAIKSSGISLVKLSRPMIGLGLIMTLFSVWFTHEIVPKANLKFFSLLYDVGKKKANISIKPGHFYSDIDGYVIRVSDKNLDRDILYDVMIYNHSDNRGAIDVILADSARTETDPLGRNLMLMTLYNGSRHEEFRAEAGKPNTYNYGRTYFDSLFYEFQLSGFELGDTDEGLFARHQVTLPYSMLIEALDSLYDRQRLEVTKYQNYLVPYNKVDTLFLEPLATRLQTFSKEDTAKIPGYVPIKEAREGKPASAAARPRASKKVKNISHKAVEDIQKRFQLTSTDSLEKAKSKSRGKSWVQADTIQFEDSAFFSAKLFNQKLAVTTFSTAISNVRAVKNYSEYMIKKNNDGTRRIRKYIYESQLRNAQPYNCIIFMIIGVSLGAIIRKGGIGVPALASVTLLTLAYVLNAQGKKFSKEDVIDPVLGAWLPTLVFGPLAIYLAYKATVEAAILDEGSWNAFFDRVRQFIREKFSKKVSTQPSEREAA